MDDLVPDSYWHAAKFLNRLTLIREAFDYFAHEVAEDEDKYRAMFPPVYDPFYDPPGHQLIGVTYLYLDPVKYMIESHETPTIVSFKGEVVGELAVSLIPKLVSDMKDGFDDYLPVLDTAEKKLKDYNGEELLLSFHIKVRRVAMLITTRLQMFTLAPHPHFIPLHLTKPSSSSSSSFSSFSSFPCLSLMFFSCDRPNEQLNEQLND